MKDRAFFPNLLESMGVDTKGRKRGKRVVPIFRSSVSAENSDGFSRQQFPLVLAWALTHWKAQGMTLRRVRIRLGERTVGMPGIAFTAITRVKHPWHLLFEVDLPSFEKFQEVQWKKIFRERRRFDWRLEAKASHTLRRYGYCSADPWSREEAAIADLLLDSVVQDTRLRRMRMGLDGDDNAWCWESDHVPLEAEMLRHANLVCEAHNLNTDLVHGITARLLGPWHRPAVLEAFGCLIPRDFNPKYDKRRPRAKLAKDEAAGVCVDAAGWKVDVFEEQVLSPESSGACVGGRLSKSFLEFFLIVLRRICERMKLRVAIGSHALGLALGRAENLALLKLNVQTRASWLAFLESVGAAQEVLIPVIRDEGKFPKDIVLLHLVARGEHINVGSKLEIKIFDILGRTFVAEKVTSISRCFICNRWCTIRECFACVGTTGISCLCIFL